jgi:hypothetical protein
MSTKGLDGFIADLTAFGEVVVPQEHAVFCKRIAFEVAKGIDSKMPVKTGLARGNWQVSTGQPIKEKIERLDPTGSTTMAENFREIQKAVPMKQVIWITNNLDYIEPLEDGHSQQARTGMVENTLNEIKEKAKSGVI